MASTSPDDDGDVGAMWRAHRAARAAKRAENTEKSAALLRESGIYFTSHNYGGHLYVAERFDFWPGTGLWHERKARPGSQRRKGRGVQKLINLLKDSDGKPSL